MTRLVNNELERTWKEAVVASFRALFWHMRGRNEKHDNSIRIT
jgi:hypothetical protein